ncbi:pantetheine-phosphate adenylyltransferase [candidate division BRC1 bacterium HGW-BRC1-1]|jgi:pantetheine-phosphate adenylyltransferase|nr:MAG: pantetheine-phosphate adenylyltransferase [candidate division BRC1 bacterium HGW-BRC1-1]
MNAKPSHALYPGSFDVLTNGHLDLMGRAVRIFDRVTIAVAHNPVKITGLFTIDERLEMLRDAVADMPGVDVQHFTTLTVDFARSIGASVIIRGLRAVSDFEYELQMAMANESLAPEVVTVFMAPSPANSFISSTTVREIAAFGGSVDAFVPPAVAARLYAKLKEKP